jgi:3-hydroxybutyryl-CoA dehydrogenase
LTRLLVVGAGTMGTQIALQAAAHGLEVVVYDAAAEARVGFRRRLTAAADNLVAKRFVEDAHLDRVSVAESLAAAAAGVDVVSESIIEDLQLKRRFWAELSALVSPETILTTNTSTLKPSEIAEAVVGPERFLAWHFHLPAFTANVVDVMPTPSTSPAITDRVMELSRAIGQVPILVQREHREYVFNTMLVALLKSAQFLAANDIASVEDVDRSWMIITAMPIGPFGMMDMIGLDTVLHIIEAGLVRSPNEKQLLKVQGWLRPKVAAGELGRKSGRGFYSYPRPAYEAPDFAPRVMPLA